MTRMLDCLVNYFGLDENDRPGFCQFFCYHILAGPGPTAGAGVAVIECWRFTAKRNAVTRVSTFTRSKAGGQRRRSPRRSTI
jgi:hypothetical protein